MVAGQVGGRRDVGCPWEPGGGDDCTVGVSMDRTVGVESWWGRFDWIQQVGARARPRVGHVRAESARSLATFRVLAARRRRVSARPPPPAPGRLAPAGIGSASLAPAPGRDCAQVGAPAGPARRVAGERKCARQARRPPKPSPD